MLCINCGTSVISVFLCCSSFIFVPDEGDEQEGNHQGGEGGEKRFIETGPEIGQNIVVERGLVSGEDIVVEGYHKLQHGMKVEPVVTRREEETENQQ